MTKQNKEDVLDDLFVGQIEEIKLKLVYILDNYKQAIEELQDRIAIIERSIILK